MLHLFADPYVRVEVSQPSRSVSRKQTKTKKNTSTPTFNETFVFGVSPKPEDLEFTYVSITVFDYERIRSDEVIGHVRLGFGSSQSSEAEHWSSVMAKAGTEVTAVHDIVDMDDEWRHTDRQRLPQCTTSWIWTTTDDVPTDFSRIYIVSNLYITYNRLLNLFQGFPIGWSLATFTSSFMFITMKTTISLYH